MTSSIQSVPVLRLVNKIKFHFDYFSFKFLRNLRWYSSFLIETVGQRASTDRPTSTSVSPFLFRNLFSLLSSVLLACFFASVQYFVRGTRHSSYARLMLLSLALCARAHIISPLSIGKTFFLTWFLIISAAVLKHISAFSCFSALMFRASIANAVVANVNSPMRPTASLNRDGGTFGWNARITIRDNDERHFAGEAH